MFRHFLIAVMIAAPLLVQPCGHGVCHYSVTVILAPPCPIGGLSAAVGTGLSDAGEVVGWYQDCDVSGAYHAFRWHPECGFEDVEIDWDGTLGNRLYGVNASGAVTGAVNYTAGPGQVSYLLPADGEAIEIPLIEGANFTESKAINALGDVTGFWGSVNAPAFINAFLWRDGKFTDLGDSIPPSFRSRAFDINDAGQAVGWRLETAQSEEIAVLWQNGTSIDLGPIPGGVSSDANAINNYGVVVGRGELRPDVPSRRGFIWQDGVYTDLIEPLPGAESMFASDINDRGTIVGGIGCPQGCLSHAVIYVNGTLYKLKDLVTDGFAGTITTARKINNAGQIICDGGIGTGAAPVLLLTPVDSKASDLTGDCTTNSADLEILLSRWNTSDPIADLNGDGAIGFFDLTAMLIDWG